MEIKAIKLPASQRFATSCRAVRQAFGDVDDLSAWFGYMTRTFSFDVRAPRRPRLSGPVVASLSVSRDGGAQLRFYPVARETYPDDAAFDAEVLPRLRSWFAQRLARPETAVLGVEQIIVEWTGRTHRTHELRYL